MCFTSLSSAKPNAIISTSGGNSMKKRVIGSRSTEVNSLSAIALNPLKMLNKHCLLFLVPLGIGAGRECHKNVLKRRGDWSHVGFRDSRGSQFLPNALFRYRVINQEMH